MNPATRRSGAAREAATAAMVWRREVLRFVRTKAAILTSLVQPILFLVVLGVGLNGLVAPGDGIDYMQFLFPGIVAMTVMTTAMMSAISIVVDREFGFLREMLVAPVSRTAIIVGKTAGGATVATAQGALLLLLAPLVGVHLGLRTVVALFLIALLMGFMLTGLGVLLASRTRRVRGFQAVTQLVLTPMLLLSGAMFPLGGLPTWLSVVTKLNPLTYAIDPFRRVALGPLTGEAALRFGNGLTVLGLHLNVAQELVLMAAFSALFVVLAVPALSQEGSA